MYFPKQPFVKHSRFLKTPGSLKLWWHFLKSVNIFSSCWYMPPKNKCEHTHPFLLFPLLHPISSSCLICFPRCSASPPPLNPSSSHLQGSHISFVLLPCSVLSTSAGGSHLELLLLVSLTAPHIYLLHLRPIPTRHLRRRRPAVLSSHFCLTSYIWSHCSIYRESISLIAVSVFSS